MAICTFKIKLNKMCAVNAPVVPALILVAPVAVCEALTLEPPVAVYVSPAQKAQGTRRTAACGARVRARRTAASVAH